MAESFVDSFRTKLISDACGALAPQLELAVVEYIGWFNDSRLHVLGGPPPMNSRSLPPYSVDRAPTQQR